MTTALKTQQEEISDHYSESTADPIVCCKETCLRSWRCIKVQTKSVWNWITSTCCPCCKKSADVKRKHRRPINKTRPDNPMDANETTQKNSEAVVKTVKTSPGEPAQPRRVKFKQALVSESNAPAPTAGATPPAPDPPALPAAPVKQSTSTTPVGAIKSTQSSSGSKKTVKSEPHLTARSKLKSTNETPPEVRRPQPAPLPPKIEFIETGSIFGGRGRHSHANNLLLDNGRFRSPGQSNITTGPGGRSIRISFQTGFPSVKSVESRASLTSVGTIVSKKSIEHGAGPKDSEPETETDDDPA